MNEGAGTQLVHWSEGRVRIKNRALRRESAWAHGIESGLRGAIGIRRVRLNRLTASLLVEYDPAAWCDAEGTRGFWTVLCKLFPNNCHAEGCSIGASQLEKFSGMRDGLIAALRAAPGIVEVRHEPATQTLHIRFDAQRFALQPALRLLTARLVGPAQSV